MVVVPYADRCMYIMYVYQALSGADAVVVVVVVVVSLSASTSLSASALWSASWSLSTEHKKNRVVVVDGLVVAVVVAVVIVLSLWLLRFLLLWLWLLLKYGNHYNSTRCEPCTLQYSSWRSAASIFTTTFRLSGWPTATVEREGCLAVQWCVQIVTALHIHAMCSC